jgi:acetyltransferase-like isoleucine patch superfamily enzyme
MDKKTLFNIDNFLYNFLTNHADIMPNRFIKFIANFYPDARIRKLYFRKLGVVMGENTYANLGMHIAINEVGEEPKIIIGDNVSIAPNVTFVAESCANNGQEINTIDYVRDKLTVNGKIIIEDEVWIGASVTILQNVTIGRCSVIGAGSVVTKDVEPYSVYAGVPAKKIRDLKSYEVQNG